MNAIVILFREKNRTSAPSAATVNGVSVNIARTVRAPMARAAVARGQAWPRKPARRALTCVWRINPASGRPECRWSLVQTGAADEGADGPDILRLAA